MGAIFNLIDVESANLVGSYESEREAREVARNAWLRFGQNGLAGLALLRVDADGTQTLVAEESELAAVMTEAAGADRSAVPNP